MNRKSTNFVQRIQNGAQRPLVGFGRGFANANDERGISERRNLHLTDTAVIDRRYRSSHHDVDLFGPGSSLETASATSSTLFLISPTCGWSSRIRSCSTFDRRSIRVVMACNSSNIACWREERRCIHQKQTAQQAMPIQPKNRAVVSRFIILQVASRAPLRSRYRP